MKKTIALLVILSIAAPAIATEPLLLEPLSPTVLSTTPGVTQTTTTTTQDGDVQVSFPNGSYTGTYDSNMVPQNAAAEGLPVPEKQLPKVKIRTKQRSQGNSYWNAGGKGTKSFF